MIVVCVWSLGADVGCKIYQELVYSVRLKHNRANNTLEKEKTFLHFFCIDIDVCDCSVCVCVCVLLLHADIVCQEVLSMKPKHA